MRSKYRLITRFVDGKTVHLVKNNDTERCILQTENLSFAREMWRMMNRAASDPKIKYSAQRQPNG